jgi:hypothetical protein
MNFRRIYLRYLCLFVNRGAQYTFVVFLFCFSSSLLQVSHLFQLFRSQVNQLILKRFQSIHYLMQYVNCFIYNILVVCYTMFSKFTVHNFIIFVFWNLSRMVFSIKLFQLKIKVFIWFLVVICKSWLIIINCYGASVWDVC